MQPSTAELAALRAPATRKVDLEVERVTEAAAAIQAEAVLPIRSTEWEIASTSMVLLVAAVVSALQASLTVKRWGTITAALAQVAMATDT